MINHPLSKDNALKGIYLGFLAFLIWSLGDACTKYAGKGEVPFYQIIALSNFAGVGLIFIYTALTGGVRRLMPNNIKLQLRLALVITLLAPVNVISFAQLPMTTCYAAWFASPLIVTLLGVIILREKLTRLRAFLIVAGFAGTLIAINPFGVDINSGTFWGWVLLPFAPFLFAVYMLMSRFLRDSETTESLSFFPNLLRGSIFLAISLFLWEPMQMKHIIAIIFMGFTMSTGAFLMNKALAVAPSSTVSPLHYSQLVIGAILDLSVWDLPPTWHMVLGSIIIIVTGVAGARLAARQDAIRQATFESVPTG